MLIIQARNFCRFDLCTTHTNEGRRKKKEEKRTHIYTQHTNKIESKKKKIGSVHTKSENDRATKPVSDEELTTTSKGNSSTENELYVQYSRNSIN